MFPHRKSLGLIMSVMSFCFNDLALTGPAIYSAFCSARSRVKARISLIADIFGLFLGATQRAMQFGACVSQFAQRSGDTRVGGTQFQHVGLTEIVCLIGAVGRGGAVQCVAMKAV